MLSNLITPQLSTRSLVCLLFLSMLTNGIFAQNNGASIQSSTTKQQIESSHSAENALTSSTPDQSMLDLKNEALVFNTGPYCHGETIQLVGPNFLGVIYEWTGPNDFTSNKKHPILLDADMSNAGTYSLTIKNHSGEILFADKHTQVIIAHQPEWIQVSNDGPKCEGEELQLFSSISAQQSVVNYQWTGPNGFSSTQQNPIIENLSQDAAGSYQLAIFVNGCFSKELSTEVKVNQIPAPPMVSFTDNLTKEDIMLSTDYFEEAQFEWVGPNGFEADHGFPVIENAKAENSGLYQCFVTVDGCTSIGGSELTVDTSQETLEHSCKIPNAISPNQDGKNDVFVISCLDQSKMNSLIIYNQRGQEIYQSENYQNDWDGTFQGKTLPTGTYFYAIQLADEKKNLKRGYLYIKS